jgi:hypothetical protein
MGQKHAHGDAESRRQGATRRWRPRAKFDVSIPRDATAATAVAKASMRRRQLRGALVHDECHGIIVQLEPRL